MFSSLLISFDVNAKAKKPQEQTIAQHMLNAATGSFGNINWNVGGNSSLEYTKSVINFINTEGNNPAYLADLASYELKNNPAINADYSSLPVLTSHKTLNNDLSLVSGPTANPKHAIIQFLDIARSVPAKLSLGLKQIQ